MKLYKQYYLPQIMTMTLNFRFLLLVILLGFCLQSNVIAQDYFVGFFGEKQSISAPVGHAFIGIGKGIPLTCNMDGQDTEMIGFYPKVRIEGAKSFWFGTVDGLINIWL